jgi:DNA-binding transcriptional LysR family regulator
MLHARILTYLDEVARSGSIRKAAARLNVASTAINRQIIALEEEMGQRLFDRIPRRLRLTAAGEVLIEHVRDTLKAFERTKARLDALKGARQGQILLATTVGFAGGPMPKIVYDFGREHPNVRILVRGMFTDAIPNAILSGDFSLGLAFNLDPNPGLRTLLKFEIPFGAVVAPSHPLANRSRVRLSDVVQYPLVLPEPSMTLRKIVDLALAKVQGSRAPILETNSIEMMKNLVRFGEAVTFLNPIDVAEERTSGRIRYLPIAEARTQTLTLVSRQRGNIDPTTSRFVEHLKTSLVTLSEGYPKT